MSQSPINNKKNKSKPLSYWHRGVGYFSLILVFILSITGLILNRTEKLDLNQITVGNKLISSIYDLSPSAPPVHFKADDHWLSWLEGRLYLDSKLIAQNTDRPVGFIMADELVIVGSHDYLSLYMEDGTLVENLNSSSLPGKITALGQSETGIILIETPTGNYLSDSDFVSWEKASEKLNLKPALAKSAPKQITENILQDFQGQGITLYRLILDLHSGRILGSFGPYLMDLAAISLIFLGITGLMKRKRNGKDRRKRK